MIRKKKRQIIRGNHEILRTGTSMTLYLKVTKDSTLCETPHYREEAIKSVAGNRKHKNALIKIKKI